MEGQKVTGREDYVLGTSRYNLFNSGVREAKDACRIPDGPGRSTRGE